MCHHLTPIGEEVVLAFAAADVFAEELARRFADVTASWAGNLETHFFVVVDEREIGRQVPEFDIGRIEQHQLFLRQLSDVRNPVGHAADSMFEQITHRAAVTEVAVAAAVQLR